MYGHRPHYAAAAPWQLPKVIWSVAGNPAVQATEVLGEDITALLAARRDGVDMYELLDAIEAADRPANDKHTLVQYALGRR